LYIFGLIFFRKRHITAYYTVFVEYKSSPTVNEASCHPVRPNESSKDSRP